jgi:hypothetical protein
MAIPAGKTPISYLQDLCTKRGITPQYDLMANEGAVHEPIFIMSVSVGDIVSTGKGQYYTFIFLTTGKIKICLHKESHVSQGLFPIEWEL